MRGYRALNNNRFESDQYSIVPIRDEDRYDIMKWRNEQLYHLRQATPLTRESQDRYFETVVSGLFDQPEPGQLLFSFLRDQKCIGYGGLVHINWIDRNAEISFIMDTALEAEEFELNWSVYLGLVERVAYDELKLHKVYVYAFDLRPHLYSMLLANGFFRDAVLKEHCCFNGAYIDVVIHSKIRQQ